MSATDDKETERQRFESRAQQALHLAKSRSDAMAHGAALVPLVLRHPYLAYEAALLKHTNAELPMLELGAGTGMHTSALLATGASVVATDIAESALKVLAADYENFRSRLTTRVADMEALPFPDGTFGVVASAGALSYGDPALVWREIRRVLAPGGVCICVDSLNHNPIYKLNRWLHHRRGSRSASTLERMPRIETFFWLKSLFADVQVEYFGSLSWLLQPASRIIGQPLAAQMSTVADRLVQTKASAFKFVLVAKR